MHKIMIICLFTVTFMCIHNISIPVNIAYSYVKYVVHAWTSKLVNGRNYICIDCEQEYIVHVKSIVI